MKKLYLILLIVLLLCAEAFPADIGFCRKHGGGAASCATSAHAEVGASDGSYTIMSGTTADWIATKFVTTSAFTACSIDLYLSKTGSPTSTVDVYIYSDDGGSGSDANPNTQVCSLGSYNMSAVGATETIITISGFSCALQTGTAYWIVSFSNAVSATDYISWHLDNGGATELIKKDEDGTGTWILTSSFNTLKFELKK